MSNKKPGSDPASVTANTTWVLPPDRRHCEPLSIETSQAQLPAPYPQQAEHRTNSEPTAFAFDNEDLFRLNAADDSFTHTDFDQVFGGLRGLEHGLRTDLRAGLGADEDSIDGTVTVEAALLSARTASTISAELSLPDAITTIHVDRRASVASTVVSTVATASRATCKALARSAEDEKIDQRHTTRRQSFGENRLPPPKQIRFHKLVWANFKQKMVLLLFLMSILFTMTAIFEHETDDDNTFAGAEPAIPLILVIFFSFGPAISDWWRGCTQPKKQEADSNVTVMRSGRAWVILAGDLVVGDVVLIQQGDIAHADGILISGCDVRVDESTITGEARAVRKTDAVKALAKAQQQAPGTPGCQPNRTHHECHLKHSVILSGSKVFKGTGRYLVTAVGVNTVNGRKYMAEPSPPARTPLQEKLDRLAKYIIYAGMVIASLFLLSQSIIWAKTNPGSSESGRALAVHWFRILMVSLALLVILVPEGLPVANQFALQFACGRMFREKIWVRCIASCETAGNATMILCDKTGTLTENEMAVVAGLVGTSFYLGVAAATDSSSDCSEGRGEEVPRGTGLCAGLSGAAVQCLRESIARNTTAHQQGEAFEGSSTETSLLRFAKTHLGMAPLEEEESRSERLKMFPFSPEQKWMAVVVDKPNEPGCRILVKGAPEAVLTKCRNVLTNPAEGNEIAPMSDAELEQLKTTVKGYASQSLRVMVLAQADLDECSPFSSSENSILPAAEDSYDKECEAPLELSRITGGNLTLLAILAIHDPLRAVVPESVRTAQVAGVSVSMVTGDSMLTAKSIAQSCNIYQRGGVIMEAWLYQLLSDAQLKMIAPRLQVLARSMPEDKARLVRCHQEMGETVIVTGDGTNDAAALRAADVGFSMGRCGTEVAKESSDIVLLDDNFGGIIRAIAWGRQVNDVVKRFLQFQATTILACAILTITSSYKDGYDASIFSVVQILWINASTDIIAGPALTRETPRDAQMLRRPEPRNTTITTVAIRKMITGQVLYQLLATYVLYYACRDSLVRAPIGSDGDDIQQGHQIDTLVFNNFVFMQIFLLLNSRSCDSEKNIFTGMFRKYWNFIRTKWFVFLVLGIAVAQILIVEIPGPTQPFGTVPLTAAQWALCIGLGAFTLPLGFLIRCTPDSYYGCIEDCGLVILRPVWGVLAVCWKCISAPFRRPCRWISKQLRALRRLLTSPFRTFGRYTTRQIQSAWRFARHGRKKAGAVLPTTQGRQVAAGKRNQKSSSLFSRQRSNETTFSKATTVVNPSTPKTKLPSVVEASTPLSGSSRAGSGRLADMQMNQSVKEVDLRDLISRARMGPVEGFEIHPDTDPDDPIIWEGSAGKGRTPPSQREKVRAWLGPKTTVELEV